MCLLFCVTKQDHCIGCIGSDANDMRLARAASGAATVDANGCGQAGKEYFTGTEVTDRVVACVDRL